MAFANKPAHADVAINQAAAQSSSFDAAYSVTAGSGTTLANIGTRASYDMTIRDYTTKNASGAPVWGVVDGGSIDLADLTDYAAVDPPAAVAEEYAEGCIFRRLSVDALPETGAARLLYSGKGTAVHADFQQGFVVGISATAVTMLRRSSASVNTTYSVAHSASGVAAGTPFDVFISWGSTRGVRLYVNGVADNQIGVVTDTESTFIRVGTTAAGNGFQVGRGPLPMANYNSAATVTDLGGYWINSEWTTTKMASLREDPHWGYRPLAPFDTQLPQVSPHSADASEQKVRVSMTATGGGPECSIFLRSYAGGTLIAGLEGTVGSHANPTLVYALAQLTFDQEYFAYLTWSQTGLGNTEYPLYPTSVTDGKAAGEPYTFRLFRPGPTSTTRVAAFGDWHMTETDAVADHKSSIVGTEASATSVQTAFDAIAALVVASGVSLALVPGDILDSGGDYAATQADSDELERIVANNAKALAVPRQITTGNWDVVDIEGEGTTVGTFRRASILRYRAGAPLDATSLFSDWGPFRWGNVGFFVLNEYEDNAVYGDVSLADQITAMGTWAAAETARWKVVVEHRISGGPGREGVGFTNAARIALHDAMVAAGIDMHVSGHNHIFHIGLRPPSVGQTGKSIIYLMAGGNPFHVTIDTSGATWKGSPYNRYAEQHYGWAEITFGAGIAIVIHKTGYSGPLNDGTDDVLGLNQVAYSYHGSFTGVSGVHYDPAEVSVNGATGVHHSRGSTTGSSGVHGG